MVRTERERRTMNLYLDLCKDKIPELLKENKTLSQIFSCKSAKRLEIHQREATGYEIAFSEEKCDIFYHTISDLNRALLYVAIMKEEKNIKETCAFMDFGVMIDASRNAVYKVDTLKKLIRLLAVCGYRFIGLYIEDTIKIDDEPYFGYLRGAFTEKELKAVDEYAKRYGMELRPYIQTLAHLNQIVRYEEYQNIIDADDILFVGDERTNTLLEHLIGTVARCFSSRKINIGMDEAHMIGLGKYLERNGYQNRQAIMMKHLETVLSICKKYGFQVQMWSDMFFRLAFQGEYYSHDVKELEKLNIPEEVELGYWDYYSIEKEHYVEMLKRHKMMTNRVAFIGGAWKWTGFIPHNRYSILNGKAALEACKEENVQSVTLACWGDDGAEASIFSVLPTMFIDSQIAYDSQMDEEAFRLLTGYDLAEFLELDDVNPYAEDGHVHNNASKYLLYNDPLIGVFDSLAEKAIDDWYQKMTVKMEVLAKRGKGTDFGYLFDTAYHLCHVLQLKANLGNEIQNAYDTDDKIRLREIADIQIPDLLNRVEACYQSFQYQWKIENKFFGFEVQTVRFGGLIQRLKDTKEILNAYITQQIDEIDLLEEKRLPFHYFEEKEMRKLNYNLWTDIVSTSKI